MKTRIISRWDQSAVVGLVLATLAVWGVSNLFAWGLAGDDLDGGDAGNVLGMTPASGTLNDAIQQHPHGGSGDVALAGAASTPSADPLEPFDTQRSGIGTPIMSSAVPVGEGAILVGEGAVPVGEGAVPVGEDARPIMTRSPCLVIYR